MFLKKLDFLSPNITFYNKGNLSHSSIFSGILSIISIIIIILFGLDYLLDMILKKDPKVFNYKTFIEDAGIFSMNFTSLYHFISIGLISNISSDFKHGGVDFGFFRIIGFEMLFDIYLQNPNLSNFDHWLYGKCENLGKNEEIGEIINYEFYENAGCIRKYFSAAEQKYYEIGEQKFRWPEITHGTFHKDYQIYSIIIDKCKEETANLILGEDSHCKEFSEFEKLGEIRSFYGIVTLYFINQYVDVLNYSNPNRKFFYRNEDVLKKGEYSVNNLNFNPTYVKTHNGILQDSIKEDYGFVYDRNDVTGGKGDQIFTGYIFFLKNIIHYNERTYKKIQDVLSNIGGIYQFVMIISIYINNFYNNYIILLDTENLLNSSISDEKNKKKKNKYEDRNNIIKDFDKIKKTSERKIFNTEITNNKNEIIKNNISQTNNNCINPLDETNLENQKKVKNINKNDDKNSNKKYKKNFIEYFLFKISFGKKCNHFKIYNDFRIKIISEEHLVKNHLNIYNLLRDTVKKKSHRRNSYRLKDLLKLV